MRYFCTYFDHNYLPQGLALYRSLRRECPDSHLYVLCLSVEAQEQLRQLGLPGLTIIALADFEAGDTALAVAKGNRTRIEYIFTCTPCLCLYVMAHYPEVDLLAYLDADLYFFSSPEPLYVELGDSSIGIIPHNYHSPGYLRFGRFNVGWISFRRDANALACIRWWRDRCLERCKDKVEDGFYADQKYLDQWPERFAALHIFQHKGANVARWNIKHSPISLREGKLWVDGQPLIFFHFASFRQLTSWLYQSNFATQWVTPGKLVRREIFGQYIAELRHIAGPILPQGSKRLQLQDLGLRDLPALARQLLRTARAILLLDYLVVARGARLEARFADRISRPAFAKGFDRGRLRKASRLWFVFADTPGFSGQKEASRLIFDNLSGREMKVGLIRMPAFNRSDFPLRGMVHYLVQMSQTLGAMVTAAFTPDPVLHLALGQTRASLVRDAIPLLLIMGLRTKKRAVVSLNGSNFMSWSSDSFEARFFRMIVRQASLLTVLGERQLGNAHRLGIPPSKVCIVPNTCDTSGLSEEQVRNKHSARAGPVRLLHLSTLIDTKGYPVYLEALELLSSRPGPRLEAVLCGNIAISQFGARFQSHAVAQAWVETMMHRLNRTERIRLIWIAGAAGEAKLHLFNQAEIFVFPSVYKVEAQPLVLLEAMAHGCTVISSTVGEIRGMLSDESALLLDEPNAESVACAIERLVAEPQVRAAMALKARREFEQHFRKTIYLQTWEKIFASLSP